MQGKKGSKSIEMIIKMVTEFKLTVFHFASPNPMQICACTWIYRWTKNCGKCGSGIRATGPSRAVGQGPLGLRAAEPSRAVGRGPLGRGPAFSKTPPRGHVISSISVTSLVEVSICCQSCDVIFPLKTIKNI